MISQNAGSFIGAGGSVKQSAHFEIAMLVATGFALFSAPLVDRSNKQLPNRTKRFAREEQDKRDSQ